jgi:plastocyanin
MIASRGWRTVLVALCATLAPATAACGSQTDDDAASAATAIPGPYDHDFTIPTGTGARIAAGEDVQVMPEALAAHVGETIRIVNDDVQSHTVGTFYVLAGTTLTYRFPTEGVFQGECSTHSSGEFVLTVTA